MKKNLIILGALVALFFSWGEKALAQEGDIEAGIPRGVQVSPFRLDWDMNSGEERTGVINLKNYSDKIQEIKIEVEDFFVSDDSSEARFFIPQAGHPLFAYDVINWIEVQDSITLGPKEGKDVIFKIKVPEGMPTGGYYGAMFFKSAVGEETNPDSGAKVLINQRVGVLMVMAVKGKEPINMKGDITKFSPKKAIFWDSPVELITEVSNEGNLHFKTFGKIEIYRFGRKVGEFSTDQRYNYPGKTRFYDDFWSFSYWAHGYYKARIYLVSEDESVKMIAETNFWIIPWKETTFVIVLLLALYMIFKWFTNKFEIKKKGDDDEEENDPSNQVIG